MTLDVDRQRLRAELHAAVDRLLAEQRPEGWWEGELSASALATATAVTALVVNDRVRHRAARSALNLVRLHLIRGGA